MDSTAAEESRQVEVEVAVADGEPEAAGGWTFPEPHLPGTPSGGPQAVDGRPLPEPHLPGTPSSELALYQRPDPASSAAYNETPYADASPAHDQSADPAPDYAAVENVGYIADDYDARPIPDYSAVENLGYIADDYDAHPTPDYSAVENLGYIGEEYGEVAFHHDPAADHQHSAEVDTAEYALPPLDDDRSAAGHFNAMLDTDDAAHPGDGRRLPRAALAVTGAALVLVGFGGLALHLASHVTVPAAARNASRAAPAATGAASPPADTGAAAGVVTAGLDGRTSASFALVSNVNTVDVRVDDLGDELYKITTPAGGPVRPDATTDGDDVRLALTHVGPGDGPTRVGIVLTSRVRWALRIAGGVQTGTLDLRGGTIGGVDLTGGAGRFDLSLPRPKGTLNVRMSGGVNTFQMETDGKVPVRVTARSGAGQIILDGTTNNGVARGASFRSPGWSAQTDRIDLDAVAGFGTLRVSYD